MKPSILKPGDTIGIVSPSWGGGALFPHRVRRGQEFLESLGFRVIMAEHALSRRGWLSGTSEERAADLHQMFKDPRVKAIIATIGGDHSCHLLPLLDFELIRDNPKVFMGFSDITVLSIAIHVKTDLVVFNGPSLMTDLAECPEPLPYTQEYLLKALMRPEPIGVVTSAPAWTDEFLDWGTRADLTRPRRLQQSSGWTWLKPGRATGRLIGGCLESLEHLRGTPYWPDLSGAILFLETSEEKPSPARIDAMLMDYENMGVLGSINGLLFARPYGYSADEVRELHGVILERTRRYDFPVIADMDFGHTSPMLTLPIGVQAEIDSTSEHFVISEAAVEA